MLLRRVMSSSCISVTTRCSRATVRLTGRDELRRRVLDPACARAGLAPIGFYVLRDTRGTIVVAGTRDVRVVQRRLRHTSAAFTLETYTHPLDDRIGVDAVGNALGERLKRPRR
jgi:integrase